MLQHLAEEEVVIMVEDTLLFTVKLRVCRLESQGNNCQILLNNDQNWKITIL